MGSATNAGTINFFGSSVAGDLIVGNVTLSGGGKIALLGSGDNNILPAANGVTLSNTDNTIAGEGIIGDNNGTFTFVNSGAVDANATSALVLDLGMVAVVNSGTLEATSSGGGLVIESDVDNANLIEALGTKTLVVLSGYTISNGALGLVAARGSGAQVQIIDGVISGGALLTSGTSAAIVALGTVGNLIDGATIESGSTVEVTSGNYLALADAIDNSGTIVVNAAAAPTTLSISGVVTLTGPGTISLSSAGTASIEQVGGAATLDNNGNTIIGAGDIDNDGMADLTFDNAGIVDANTGNALTVNTLTNVLSNTSVMEATSSGGLILGGYVDNADEIAALGMNAKVLLSGSTVTDSGLILASGNGAHVDMDGAIISGGTLKTSGINALFNVVGGGNGLTLSGATIASGTLVNVENGGSLQLNGAIVNSGTISATESAGVTQINLYGTVTLSGHGSLIMSQGSNGIDLGAPDAGTTFTNVDNTIAGDGTIGESDADLTFINSGTVDADVAANLNTAVGELAIETQNAVTNVGTLEATNSGALVMFGLTINNGGLIVASGPKAEVALDETTISGGTLRTSGSSAAIVLENGTTNNIFNNVTNSGLVEVGNNVVLELTGGSFTNDGTVQVGSEGGIQIDSNLALSGSGAVVLQPGVNPNAAIDAETTGLTLTNSSHISGAGQIGAGGLMLINSGTVDGNSTAGLEIVGMATDINGGTLEGTAPGGVTGEGGLDIDANLTNSGVIEALGTSATVTIFSATVTNAGSGNILASGAGANVVLFSATISGGTLKTSGAVANIETEEFTSNTISGATIAAGLVEVTNDATLTLLGATFGSGATLKDNGGTAILSGGTIDSGGVVEVTGGTTIVPYFTTLNNSGALSAAGGFLDIYGQVAGGTVEIGNGTLATGLGQSHAITFQAGGSGDLQLSDDAANNQAYSGEVTGFGQNVKQLIELGNVTYNTNVSGTYASANAANTSGTLTVMSGAALVADIDLIGHYTTANFHITTFSGDVVIYDPPVVGGGGQGANAALLGNYIAGSFASGGGYSGNGPTGSADTTASAVLTHAHS
jgi:hypothetical protein